MSKNTCNCMFCRRKEFGKSYALYIYSELMNNISICCNLVKNGIKEDRIGEDTIGSYLSAIRFDTDELICMFFIDEDKENDRYLNYLKKHDLLDTLNSAIERYNELWNKK